MSKSIGRPSKKQITLSSDKNSLRLQIPASLSKGIRTCYRYLGLEDNMKNRTFATKLIAEINTEITNHSVVFEESFSAKKQLIEEYKLGKTENKVNTNLAQSFMSGLTNCFQRQTLISMYLEYASYKQPNLAKTTYIRRYQGFYKRSLERCPHQNVKDGLKIREYLLDRHVRLKAKEILNMLSEMVEWAKLEEKLPHEFRNAFKRYARDITIQGDNSRTPYQVQQLINQGIFRPMETKVKGFTWQEAEAIIRALEKRMASQFSNSTPWDLIVEFLFMTGCRHGECAALRWSDIPPDCSHISFSRSYDDRLHLEKETKTYESRSFFCYPALQEFLINLKPKDADPNDLVFHCRKKTHITWESLNQIWNGKGRNPKDKGYIRGILPTLIAEGKIETYHSPYGTRHTFINAQIQAGIGIKDIANMVGNTPATIAKHYESISRDKVYAVNFVKKTDSIGSTMQSQGRDANTPVVL